jgi:putative transposase
MALRAYRYRLYPTKAQEKLFEQTLDACRWVYNKTLEVRKAAWEERQESLNLYATNRLLTQWKKERLSLKVAFSQALQDAQERVDLGFKAFFRRVKSGETPGYPRFRGRHRYDSWTYPQFGFSLDADHRRVNLSKIGAIKIVLHRPVEGQIKTLTIRRTTTGNWYACFSCEVELASQTCASQAVGVDVGLASFATLSTGEKIANPRFFRSDEKALARAQRRLAKAEKGTLLRVKRRQAVAQVHERIANRRHDFAHKIGRQLADCYGLVVFEDLNTTGMLANHCLAKSIADAAWNQLIQYTTYKAEDAGHRVVLVNPRNTSKMCSGCGTLVDKDLSVRVHICPECGLVLDRDENAAMNILRLGLQAVGIQSLEAQPV